MNANFSQVWREAIVEECVGSETMAERPIKKCWRGLEIFVKIW
jgi:hypothetical protein